MSNPQFLRNVIPGDGEFVKFAILQSWLEEACIKAGISLNPLSAQQVLDEIRAGDTDLQKWQKVTSWAQQLATNITSGGGSNTTQGSTVSVTTGLSSLAVTFATAFAAAPAVACNLIPPSGSNQILCDPVNVTTTGFTATWGFAIPANYKLSWVAAVATQ